MIGVVKPYVIGPDYGYCVDFLHGVLEAVQFGSHLFRSLSRIIQDLAHACRRLRGISQIQVPLNGTVMDAEIYAEYS